MAGSHKNIKHLNSMPLLNDLKSRHSILLLAGLIAVPVLQVTAGYLSQPEWSRRTFFGGYLYAPLLGMSFVPCVLAPFFSDLPVGRRIGYALAGVFLFFTTFLITAAACIRLFGLPD